MIIKVEIEGDGFEDSFTAFGMDEWNLKVVEDNMGDYGNFLNNAGTFHHHFHEIIQRARKHLTKKTGEL